ncbi:MAG: flagellar hook-length control protein FliK [Limnochordaceae bacterium]|nr:flagellar hook-length control protein FliK [Limnochordaceae bacterium]
MFTASASSSSPAPAGTPQEVASSAASWTAPVGTPNSSTGQAVHLTGGVEDVEKEGFASCLSRAQASASSQAGTGSGVTREILAQHGKGYPTVKEPAPAGTECARELPASAESALPDDAPAASASTPPRPGVTGGAAEPLLAAAVAIAAAGLVQPAQPQPNRLVGGGNRPPAELKENASLPVLSSVSGIGSSLGAGEMSFPSRLVTGLAAPVWSKTMGVEQWAHLGVNGLPTAPARDQGSSTPAVVPLATETSQRLPPAASPVKPGATPGSPLPARTLSDAPSARLALGAGQISAGRTVPASATVDVVGMAGTLAGEPAQMSVPAAVGGFGMHLPVQPPVVALQLERGLAGSPGPGNGPQGLAQGSDPAKVQSATQHLVQGPPDPITTAGERARPINMVRGSLEADPIIPAQVEVESTPASWVSGVQRLLWPAETVPAGNAGSLRLPARLTSLDTEGGDPQLAKAVETGTRAKADAAKPSRVGTSASRGTSLIPATAGESLAGRSSQGLSRGEPAWVTSTAPQEPCPSLPGLTRDAEPPASALPQDSTEAASELAQQAHAQGSGGPALDVATAPEPASAARPESVRLGTRSAASPPASGSTKEQENAADAGEPRETAAPAAAATPANDVPPPVHAGERRGAGLHPLGVSEAPPALVGDEPGSEQQNAGAVRARAQVTDSSEPPGPAVHSSSVADGRSAWLPASVPNTAGNGTTGTTAGTDGPRYTSSSSLTGSAPWPAPANGAVHRLQVGVMPAELGPVQVDVRSRHGELSVQLASDEPLTRRVLQQHRLELQERLDLSGLRVQDITIRPLAESGFATSGFNSQSPTGPGGSDGSSLGQPGMNMGQFAQRGQNPWPGGTPAEPAVVILPTARPGTARAARRRITPGTGLNLLA